MRFLRRSESSGSTDTVSAAPETDGDPADDERPRTHTTTGKGRATPKRRDAEGRRRGPAPAPPRTQREASKLARANRPSKEERRAKSLERRRRMDAGDDRVLLPRDRGKVRAHVRDIVDSRPHVIGLFLPLAALVLVAALVQNPVLQQYITLFTFLMLAVMVVEGTLLGVSVLKRVREKFPEEEVKGLPTGWYAFSRATQPRRMRVPKPKVKRGDNV